MLRDPYELNEYDAEMQADERRAQRSAKDWTVPAVSTLILFGIVGGLYYYNHVKHVSVAEPASVDAVEKEEEVPAPPPQPDIRYPVQRSDATPKKLPVLAKSDPEVRAALNDVVSKDALKLLNLDSLIRRIVVTTDNLSRDKIPQRYSMTKPVERSFQVSGKDNDYVMKTENYGRYTPYVRWFEAIDTKQLIGAYVYFYPLLQEEYRNIGSPKQYYNDRVVEIIDHLLAAPQVQGPVKLVQPKVFYEFADPSLEALSIGQKLMIRMGSENAARVKTKLRQIRAELTTLH
ncbi:MAG TPA: DUF3014 domain-containing protein [Burkholderiales bacterium]|nr:DUF3014 domain-containing protein [Burkholderiales bacterium]